MALVNRCQISLGSNGFIVQHNTVRSNVLGRLGNIGNRAHWYWQRQLQKQLQRSSCQHSRSSNIQLNAESNSSAEFKHFLIFQRSLASTIPINIFQFQLLVTYCKIFFEETHFYDNMRFDYQVSLKTITHLIEWAYDFWECLKDYRYWGKGIT